MPERPGSTDLDDTFAQLVDVVDQRTSPPGADRAVRTAHRRRTAAAGALAAAVVAASVLGGTFLSRASGTSLSPVR